MELQRHHENIGGTAAIELLAEFANEEREYIEAGKNADDKFGNEQPRIILVCRERTSDKHASKGEALPERQSRQENGRESLRADEPPQYFHTSILLRGVK